LLANFKLHFAPNACDEVSILVLVDLAREFMLQQDQTVQDTVSILVLVDLARESIILIAQLWQRVEVSILVLVDLAREYFHYTFSDPIKIKFQSLF